MAKNKIKKGTAVWITETGGIKTRVFDVEKVGKDSALIKFSPSETYKVKKNNIRGKRIVMYRKSDGSVASMNPDSWGNLNIARDHGIKTLRFNLQNSSLQESKSSIYRWMAPKNTIDKLSPIFKLLFICIAVGVMGWAALKYGGVVLDAVTKSRLMDCSQLLPKVQTPVGAILNNTVPVGAG